MTPTKLPTMITTKFSGLAGLESPACRAVGSAKADAGFRPFFLLI
jgi:hypothetical protein